MAEFNMDNYSAYADDSGKATPNEVNARVKCLIDEYTLLAELSVNDELLLHKLPEGAKIIDAILDSDQLGTTGILDLGLKAYTNKAGSSVAEDADALIASADAGGQAVKAKMAAGAAGFGAEIGKGGAQPFVTCTEASDAGTGDTIRVVILYSLDS
jgi:hypothetical protein